MALRSRRVARSRLVALALLAFALRSLIPIGFMPAGDGTLSLMICPGGLPAGALRGGEVTGKTVGQETDRSVPTSGGIRTSGGMAMSMSGGMRISGGMLMPGGTPLPAHSHHGNGLMDEGYCGFTTGFSSAPPPLLLAALLLLLSYVALITVTVLAPAGIRLVHLPQARAPPAAV
jgi:hypothetical protein